MDIGSKIDSLYDLRKSRLELETKVKEMKEQESSMRGEIIGLLQDETLEGAKGKTATASLTYSKQPQPVDWDAIYHYIAETGRFALLHRRISAALWQDIHNTEGEIPGIESLDVVDLSLTKSKRS